MQANSLNLIKIVLATLLVDILVIYLVIKSYNENGSERPFKAVNRSFHHQTP